MNAASSSASAPAAPGVNDELLAAMIAGHYADTVGSDDDDDDDDDYTVKGDQAMWGTPLFKVFMSQAGVTKKVSAAPAPPPRTPAGTLTGAPRPSPPVHPPAARAPPQPQP